MHIADSKYRLTTLAHNAPTKVITRSPMPWTTSDGRTSKMAWQWGGVVGPKQRNRFRHTAEDPKMPERPSPAPVQRSYITSWWAPNNGVFTVLTKPAKHQALDGPAWSKTNRAHLAAINLHTLPHRSDQDGIQAFILGSARNLLPEIWTIRACVRLCVKSNNPRCSA